MRDEYEKDIVWLAKTIPPDDIYDFALQTYHAAEYFLAQWAKYEDLSEVYARDRLAKIWLKNIISFRMMKEDKLIIKFDFEEVDLGENNP